MIEQKEAVLIKKPDSNLASVESDAVVSSTVNEYNISFDDEAEDVERDSSTGLIHRRPLWCIMPSNENKLLHYSKSHTSENLTQTVTSHDFEVPEFEFDDDGISLVGHEEEAFEGEYLGGGRMTPDGVFDEDFERELSWYTKELCVQEVINSDFRDVSRLGILQVAGDDHVGRKVIAFYACRLPPVDLIDHERLLLYVKKTLEQYVQGDYCIVYFHWGLTSRNKPSFAWLVKAYRTFDRSFRKNLKSLLIVYPTRTVKMMYNFFRPFISRDEENECQKMNRKLVYVKDLAELQSHLCVNQLMLPLRIRDYDTKLDPQGLGPVIDPGDASVFGDLDLDLDDSPFSPTQQFGVSLQYIKSNNGGRAIPGVIEDVVIYLRDYGMNTPGLFLRSAKLGLLRDLQTIYNRGETVDLCEFENPHLATLLLKTFLRELKQPLMTFELYENAVAISGLLGPQRQTAIRDLMINKLPDDNYVIFAYIFKFLTEVLEHANTNMLTAANLAVTLGPTLIWSHQQHVSMPLQSLLNAFIQMLITHYESIFVKPIH